MRRTLTAIAATAALSLVPAVPALAHVEHAQGDLTIAVGFATEPAYAGQPNAVQLLVSRAEKSVTDLAPGDLAVEIGFAGRTTSVAAEPDFEVGEWGTPGDYRAPADTARLVAMTAAILAAIAIELAIGARRGAKGQNAT